MGLTTLCGRGSSSYRRGVDPQDLAVIGEQVRPRRRARWPFVAGIVCAAVVGALAWLTLVGYDTTVRFAPRGRADAGRARRLHLGGGRGWTGDDRGYRIVAPWRHMCGSTVSSSTRPPTPSWPRTARGSRWSPAASGAGCTDRGRTVLGASAVAGVGRRAHASPRDLHEMGRRGADRRHPGRRRDLVRDEHRLGRQHSGGDVSLPGDTSGGCDRILAAGRIWLPATEVGRDLDGRRRGTRHPSDGGWWSTTGCSIRRPIHSWPTTAPGCRSAQHRSAGPTDPPIVLGTFDPRICRSNVPERAAGPRFPVWHVSR